MLTKNTRPPGAPSLPLGLEGERSLVSYLLSLSSTLGWSSMELGGWRMLFTCPSPSRSLPEAQHSLLHIQSYLSLQSLTSGHRMKAGGMAGWPFSRRARVTTSG